MIETPEPARPRARHNSREENENEREHAGGDLAGVALQVKSPVAGKLQTVEGNSGGGSALKIAKSGVAVAPEGSYPNNEPVRPLQVGEYAPGSGRTSIGIIRSAHTQNSEFKSWDFGVGDRANFGHNDFFGFRCVENQVTPMVLDSGGRVGVGTTAPKAKLDVEGDFIALRKRAADEQAVKLLREMPNNSLIVGGVSGNNLYFYWKAETGETFRALVTGQRF